jgi:hypothetical protein
MHESRMHAHHRAHRVYLRNVRKKKENTQWPTLCISRLCVPSLILQNLASAYDRKQGSGDKADASISEYLMASNTNRCAIAKGSDENGFLIECIIIFN